jgi:protein farnesyltransferase subunit beta
MSFEGGFNGRSNKLVDGCYSFWQGGALAIVSKLYSADASVQVGPDPWLQEATKPSTTATREDTTYDDLLFDQGMLQRYILLCAQDVHGGLRDKPSSFRDFYHSCYNLSGLSVTQYGRSSGAPAFGHAQLSRVAQTHPVYNIRIDRVSKVLAHFSELGLPK